MEGWEAECIDDIKGIGRSYHVRKCPQYKAEGIGEKKEYRSDELIKVLEAALELAKEDYEHSIRFDVSCRDAEEVKRSFETLGLKKFPAWAEKRYQKGLKLIGASVGKPWSTKKKINFWVCPNCGQEKAYKTGAQSGKGNAVIYCLKCRLREYVSPGRVDLENVEQYLNRTYMEENDGE